MNKFLDNEIYIGVSRMHIFSFYKTFYRQLNVRSRRCYFYRTEASKINGQLKYIVFYGTVISVNRKMIYWTKTYNLERKVWEPRVQFWKNNGQNVDVTFLILIFGMLIPCFRSTIFISYDRLECNGVLYI